MAKRKTSRKEMLREPAAAYGGPGGEVVLYQAPDGTVQLEVRLEQDTIWLTQKQMALLFDTERSVITKHLRNIFQSGELEEKSNVQKMHIPGSDKPVAFYNLDAVISVGYRVNSKRGTQFRIWATQVLREHILKGYTVNARRLEELKQTVKLVSTLADRRSLSSDEATALLRVVRDYTFALDVLDAYDHGRLPASHGVQQASAPISLEETRKMISAMRTQYGRSALFGQEQGDRLAGALSAIFQTADGREVYPTLEEKAAHLLYFLVKDHPFVDGNKRIGAVLFLRFLEKNGLLYRSDGSPLMSEEALVALTLLVAESMPREKDTIVRLIAFLLQRRSEDLEERP
ncbi:MAG: RhuM family protein [Acidobacteriota bacterium]